MMTVKTCTKCGVDKPLAEYYRRSNRASGYASQCIECDKVYKRKNAERILERNRKYRAENRELYRAADKKRRSNPRRLDQKRDANRRYFKKHYAIDPVRFLSKCHIRNRRIRETGTVTQAEWDALCERAGYRCLSCGKKRPLTMDHIVPVSVGGSHTIDNLQPLCKQCNCSKGTDTKDYRRAGSAA